MGIAFFGGMLLGGLLGVMCMAIIQINEREED